MEGVRQANIYPTCRLDKMNRAVHQLEDVGAKRAGLSRVGPRIPVKPKGLLKKKVLAMNTARASQEDTEEVRHAKEVLLHVPLP